LIVRWANAGAGVRRCGKLTRWVVRRETGKE